MTEVSPTKPIDWKVPETADQVEHQKLKKSFHEQEKKRNKNQLLYPPDERGRVQQLDSPGERRS